jgi:large subunit ribosomal protein L4
MEVEVKTLDGGSAGTVALADEIFGLEPRADILHRVVRWQLAKRQAGTHHAMTRNEVNRTGKKMYRQKGTGGARHGDKKAPQFRGGGKAFGPVPRSHEHNLPKKVRALGLKLALSAKARGSNIVVLEEASTGVAKTKALKEKLAALGLTNALIVDGAEPQAAFRLAARAIHDVDVLPVQGINVYDILRRDTLVLTKAAVSALEERFK